MFKNNLIDLHNQHDKHKKNSTNIQYFVKTNEKIFLSNLTYGYINIVVIVATEKIFKIILCIIRD